MKSMRILMVVIMTAVSITAFGQTMDEVIAKFNEAAESVNKGEYPTAINEFNDVLAMGETVGSEADDLMSKAKEQLPLLHYQVAISYMKQKDYENAIPYLERTIDLSRKYENNDEYRQKAMRYLPQLITGVGTGYYKKGDYERALELFTDAVKYAPNYPKAYLGKGLVHMKEYDEDEMISSLTTAITMAKQQGDDKTVKDAQEALGSYYVDMGKMEMADMDPAAEDFTYALEAFEKAVEYDPDNTDALYNLAAIHNKMVEYDKAIEYGKRALENADTDVKIAAIQYELGNSYFNTAQYDLACEAFNNAMVGPFEEMAIKRKEKVPGCN